MRRHLTATALLLGLVLLIAGPAQAQSNAQKNAHDRDGFSTFISPQELVELRKQNANVVILDARSAEEYAKGHIPGAINVPGEDLRTPSAKPGQGDSQYVFRTEDGQPDVQRYEQILGQAGLSRDDTVVVYGNHAGKADGSVAAMLLDWLGQKKVLFLDGVGMSEWYEAGFDHETEPTTRPATQYKARPREGFVWNLQEVVSNIGDDDTLFYDTRALAEYTGEDKRSNQFGGHIPGAVRCDYADFLNEDKTLKSRQEIESILRQAKLDQQSTDDKTLVLYCQTATRVSLPYLVLRELGYDNVSIYDASWHEYGNRQDTPKAQ